MISRFRPLVSMDPPFAQPRSPEGVLERGPLSSLVPSNRGVGDYPARDQILLLRDPILGQQSIGMSDRGLDDSVPRLPRKES